MVKQYLLLFSEIGKIIGYGDGFAVIVVYILVLPYRIFINIVKFKIAGYFFPLRIGGFINKMHYAVFVFTVKVALRQTIRPHPILLPFMGGCIIIVDAFPGVTLG